MSFLPTNLDDVLKIVSTLGFAGIGGALAGGLTSSWKARNDRRALLDQRRSHRLKLWRGQLRAAAGQQQKLYELTLWSEIRVHLSKALLDEVEAPFEFQFTSIEIEAPGRVISPRTSAVEKVLDELAGLEVRWKLI